jgi:hypothetical protein
VTITEVAPHAWDALLDRIGCADAYFRHGYVEASCILDGGRAALLHVADAGGDVVFACSIRPIPSEERLHDVTTPYGYGGPVGTGTAPPFEAFWQCYEHWCAENRVISTFLRFHPLLENHHHAGPFVQLEALAGTISWHLEGGEDLVEGMHRHHRRVARKATAAVDVEARERPETLDSFVTLYEATMRRRGAAAFYFFPPAYWAALAGGLREQLVRFDAVVSDDVVASVLCLASRPWLHYHLGAAVEPARALGASHLLILSAARWGQKAGYHEFHLGGGVGGRDDSLMEYKRRFAPDGHRRAWIGKMVHDEDAYIALAGSSRRSGFFPEYRRSSANV